MSDATDLTPRFEIRRLGEEHVDWVRAIVMHSNLFYSPVWPHVYPEGLTKRAYGCYRTGEYLVRHQIASGMSFGVFDKEYQFKRPESAKTGGALYWDENDLNATKEQLLEQMDFPLVSIAMSYDGASHLDIPQMTPLFASLPLFPVLYQHIGELDPRDPESWDAKGPGEVLMRNGTSTRGDYEGSGVMKKAAHWLIREAASKGYRGIQIECLHDAVTKTWLNPPAPYKGTLICQFNLKDYEVEEDGKKTKPYAHIDQIMTKIYVDLR
jgi:hypothetical protein